GLVLTKLAGAGDLRSIGSGNIGATNVLRTGRKGLALMTVILDGGKGALVMFIATLCPRVQQYHDGLLNMHVIIACAGLAAVLGHNFPIWAKFKGGKGVATTLGVMLYSSPLTGILTCLTWLTVAIAFKYSSLSALVALTLAPVYAWAIGVNGTYICAYAILAVSSAIRHRTNIQRLLNGTESKISLKKKK
ncbi:MAG: glycerol-3-phosphate 1-O-acyltransferase PlsY, partial [Alphaproteobacteria bacterium]|nr:glycerol-3-phosphate 1-O-acyltransferase PlsY [Alphaproteobacteria bacterium]